MAPRVALGRRTVSIELETKVHMVKFCVEHGEGFRDCMSPTALRFALPLAWITATGTLLMFMIKAYILALALNLPFLIKLTVSLTGLLSGAFSSGFVDSLMRSNSAWMPVAKARASISHGDHLVQFSGSLTE